MKNQVFAKKKNEDGSDYIDPITNDFVMELVSEEIVVVPIADAVAMRIKEIDEKTQKILAEGFSFDGKKFSLSNNAQMNWKDYSDLAEKHFPIKVSTIDDDIYLLTFDKVKLFYEKAIDKKKAALQKGSEIKENIKKMKDTEDVLNLKDTR